MKNLKSKTNIVKSIALTFVFSTLVFLSSAQFYNGSNQSFGKNRIQHDEYFWYYFRYPDQNIYFYAGGEDLAEFTAKKAPVIRKELELRFDYELDDKVQFIIYNKLSNYHQSNIDYVDENFNTGGQTELSDNKVFLHFTGDYNELEKQIRYGLAYVIVNRMMFGENWKEVVKNSALLAIPEWYTNGLISYASQPWDAHLANRVRDGYVSGKYKQFNRLENQEAENAGYSIWRYIEQVYGNRVIPNIVYMARVSRNVESGFLFVLGISIKELIRDCSAYYAAEAEVDEQNMVMPKEEYAFKRAAKREIYQMKLSPDAKSVAYVSNHLGRYKVYLQDLETGKRKVVFKGGTKLYRIMDLSSPLLEWHPDGEILAVLNEKKADSYLNLYNTTSDELIQRPVYQLEKVLSMDYSADGKKLLFSAMNRGKSDIYEFSVASSALTKLTDDVFDDLDAKYMKGSNDVLFSSNRPDESMVSNQASKEQIQAKKDIFILKRSGVKKTLVRISDTPSIDERQPVEKGNNEYYFLADHQNYLNRYKAIRDSAISRIDTAFHYRYFTRVEQITNYKRNILEADYVNDGFYELIYYDKKYRMYKEFAPNEALSEMEEQIQAERNAATFEDLSNELQVYYESIEIAPDSSRKKIDIYNYRFEDSEIKVVELKENRYLTIDTAAIKGLGNRPIPQQRNYAVNFTATNLVSAMDFDFANELYQPFNGGPFTPPGMGALLKVGVLDLFEDYKFEGGIRFGLTQQSTEFFLSLDNRKKRLDKRYVYQRQHLTFINDLAAERLNINKFSYILKYPFSETFSAILHTSLRSDRTVYLSTDLNSLNRDDAFELRAGAKLELIYDNTRVKGLNLYHGTRFKVFAERYQLTNFFEQDFNVLGLDFRHYQKIHRDLIFAVRGAWSTSLGAQKLVYYLGSVDNWVIITDRPRFDRQTQIASDQNYRFQAIGTNMRGFIQNVRNGNSFAVINSEFRWPVFKYFSNRPLKSEFATNFQLVAFADVGSAWTGWNPYSESNQFNTFVIEKPPLTIYLDNKKDPLVGSYGGGLRTKLWGYFVRLDYAWGIEDRRVQTPVTHLSLGLDF